MDLTSKALPVLVLIVLFYAGVFLYAKDECADKRRHVESLLERLDRLSCSCGESFGE